MEFSAECDLEETFDDFRVGESLAFVGTAARDLDVFARGRRDAEKGCCQDHPDEQADRAAPNRNVCSCKRETVVATNHGCRVLMPPPAVIWPQGGRRSNAMH